MWAKGKSQTSEKDTESPKNNLVVPSVWAHYPEKKNDYVGRTPASSCIS